MVPRTVLTINSFLTSSPDYAKRPKRSSLGTHGRKGVHERRIHYDELYCFQLAAIDFKVWFFSLRVRSHVRVDGRHAPFVTER
jgi:hypothetical protein